MQQFNAFAFYNWGKAVFALRQVKEGDNRFSVNSALLVTSLELIQLTHTLEGQDELPLPLSRTKAKEIYRLAKNRSDVPLTEDNYKEALTSQQAKEIHKIADEFETLLKAELAKLNLYLIPAIGAYDTTVLIEAGEKLLASKLAIERLQAYPMALDDIRIAARCLAFDLWTATGFHIARATELLIQEYWKQERGNNKLPPKGASTWVALCRELEGRPATATKPEVLPGGDQKLVKFLMLIGSEYRNPLVHPDHSLDETDGNLLLEGCKAAITKLLSKLLVITPAPAYIPPPDSMPGLILGLP